MRQAHLILVTGLPGTGKTTLARALAARYGVPILCKDTIKEPLLDVLGASARGESRRLSDASFAVLFALARDILRAGADLILEGNFRPGEHEPSVQALVLDCAPVESAPGAHSAQPVRVAQILCRTSEPIRIARLQARVSDPTRHAGHRDADLATAAPPLDFLALPGERLVFDSEARSASEVDASRLRQCLDRLDDWLHPRSKEP